MSEQPWFYGVLREGGGYRLVASGPTEGRVRRAMSAYTTPTMVVLREELSGLGISEKETGKWGPPAI